MSTSAATKRVVDVNEIINTGVKQKTTPTAKQEAKADIKTNPFYKVIFDPSLTPEKKKSAIAKLLSEEVSKEERRERVKAHDAFKEYLQSVREQMAVEIIKLTDTETFSELKNVYEDLHNALNDFNDKMSPLSDIIDAVYTLRTNGLAFDAFREIQNDRKAEQEIVQKRDILTRGVEDEVKRINNLNAEISSLRNKRSFFGFGGLTAEAQQAIAVRENEIYMANENLNKAKTELQNLTVSTSPSALGEHVEAKSKLRDLLDISSDEHKERQKALVDAALNFVKTTKERVGSVNNHLLKMNDQTENLGDNVGQMTQIYAVLNEGIKEAVELTQKQRETLLAAPEKEDTLQRLTREEKKQEAETHITRLDASAADTVVTFGDLMSQTTRIKTMKDANDQQIVKARHMATQGVAGVADRLSVVLQAVSGAALGESSSLASDTLAKMAESTNKVAQKESIRIAMGISDQNSALDKAINDLAAYGEVTKAATNISREGITEMREKLAEMERISREVKDNIDESFAVNADVGRGVVNEATPETKSSDTGNPFKLGA